MNIYRSISELVGKTPLLEMTNYEKNNALDAKIYAKVEFFNPAGSAKDRVAKQMIENAEKEGVLKKGATIIEPTSGNTGIALCAIARSKGYKCIIVMPDTMSQERRNLMKAYGAELVLTDGRLGMKGAIDKAEELARSIDGAYIPSQFTNKSNPQAHFLTTGPEIWQDTEGSVDIFVACVGTGGTLSGVGEYLKNQNKNIKIVAVEPHSSPLLSKGEVGSHKIQGIGANFIPDTLNRDIYDEIITVTNEDAYEYSRQITANEGLLVGISSGAAFCAAVEISKRKENRGKNIVVLFPDSGERYLSTPNFIK